MERKFNVVYVGCIKNAENKWEEGISEAEILWEDGIYDERVSYRDNLSYMAQCIVDDGFLRINQDEIINANRIISFRANIAEVSSISDEKKQKYNHRRKSRRGRNIYQKLHSSNEIKDIKSDNGLPETKMPTEQNSNDTI